MSSAKQQNPLWFFDPEMSGLGVRGLSLQLEYQSLKGSKRAYYPCLVCQRNKNSVNLNAMKTKSMQSKSFYINDTHFVKNIRIAVRLAYRVHLRYHEIDETPALKAELDSAIKYVASEEFYERIHYEILNKAKSIEGGLKSVRFYPRWVKNGALIGVSFSNVKSTFGIPTLELNNTNLNGEKIHLRKNIKDYRSLFLWAANYVAKLIVHNPEIKEVALEYAIGIYWMLKGDWYQKAIKYGLDVTDESTYSLDLTKWLQRIDTEYGFIKSNCLTTILGVTSQSINKPFNFTIEEQLTRKPRAEITSRKIWLAVIHSFGSNPFEASEVQLFLSLIGYKAELSLIINHLKRDCELIEHTNADGKREILYRAIRNI